MKKIYTLFMTAALLIMCGGKASAITYEDIDWSKYATSLSNVITTNTSNPTYVYLYNVDQKKFLTNGGEYGMEGILANVGMRLYITQLSSNGANSTYEIHSTIENKTHAKGNVMGMDAQKSIIYFDRASTDNSTNFSSWKFGNGNEYTISQSISSGFFGWSTTTYFWDYASIRDPYGTDYHTRLYGTTTASDADKWYIITYDKYQEVLEDLEDDYVDISGLILDSRFDRNSTDASNWTFSATTDSYIYTPYFVAAGTDSQDESNGAFVTARLGNEQTTLTQTITGLKAGRYRVTCQGFYNNNGSDNECAYLVADGGVTGETGKKALQKIEDTDATTLSEYDKTNTTDEIHRAIKAGMIFAKDNKYADGTVEDPYFNEVFVTVGESGTLTIGISKECTDGEVYVDNFRLFFVNEKETTDTKLYLSANVSSESQIDMNGYKSAYDCYLRRSFTLNEWEPLCLPFDLTFQQLTEAFGDGVELCELRGIKDGTMIVFSPVSISATASAYVKKDHCYVIKVKQAPDYSVSETTPKFTNQLFTTETTKHGPIYVIPDVKQDEITSLEVEGTAQEGDFTTATFTCYYKKTTAGAGSYIESAGKMYNVTDGTATVYGTTWVITETGGANSISIDGVDDSTSSISGIVLDGNEYNDNKVYNLNGMVVGTASQKGHLQKGIYIMNGKKYVVR